MATVEVILREKIKNLGAEADVVKVKRGFASNFLIPQGKAFEATKSNLRKIPNLKESRSVREAEELANAESVAGRLKKQRLKMELSTGQRGKAFGSITTIDIAKALQDLDKKFSDIDRHDILLDKPIKSTGEFEIPVRIHPDVEATIKIRVTAAGADGEDVEVADEE